MRNLGIEHDGFTFPIINQAVLLVRNRVVCGGTVHCLAIKMGFQSDIYFCNSMIDFYAKTGRLGYAWRLFEEMCDRDLVSWTSMIGGFVSEGDVSNAFELFRQMRLELEPNSVTLVVILQACCSHGSGIEEGRQLHGYVIKRGFVIDGSLQNSILKMYSNKGGIGDAEIFFNEIPRRDVVSWNILISFYTSREDVIEVVRCFNEMQEEVRPNVETLTLLIAACANYGNHFEGKKLHGFSIKSGLDDNILKTSLLDFYAKCGDIETSTQLFKEIPSKNIITWNAMMSGLIENRHFEQAIELFQQMQDLGVKPAAEVLRSLVTLYTHLGALRLGKGIHAYIIKNLFCSSGKGNTPLDTAILNMYVRCGSIRSAKTCFDRIKVGDLVSWTSMIEGYGAHGFGLEALQLFHQMVEEGLEPNGVTFLSLLSACSHSGLVNEGCEIFHSMIWRYSIQPDVTHYTCIVDLLGRTGRLKEALSVILKLVDFPDGRIWGALLSAARVHGNQKLGEYAARRLLELEADSAGYYTLLSNIQATSGRWDEVEEVRRCMKDNDLIKKPGWSCIEANGVIHGFVSGDQSHRQIAKVYDVLEALIKKIPETGCTLYD
ncbi:hypothetical protein NMG60_11003559 [Bertholletia excelsa]